MEESQNEQSPEWELQFHPVRPVDLEAKENVSLTHREIEGKLQTDIHLVVQTGYSVLVGEQVRFGRCRGQCARLAIALILQHGQHPQKIFTEHTIGELIVAIRVSKVDGHSQTGNSDFASVHTVSEIAVQKD